MGASAINKVAQLARILRMEQLPIVGRYIRQTGRFINEWMYRDCGLTANIDGQLEIRLSPRSFSGGRFSFDPKLTDELKRLARPGRHLLDAGSHIGIASLIYAGHVDAETRIVAFEPNPNTYPLLHDNNRVNELRIETFRMALGDFVGVTKFFVDGIDANASLSGDAPQKYWYWANRAKPVMKECRVPITTIDAICSALAFTPSLIKLDVEGAELQVLKGAANIIRQHKPVILLETHVFAWESFGYTREDLERCIFGMGYKIYDSFEKSFSGPLGSGPEKDNNHFILMPL